jgi:hypothetical protein
MSLPSTPVKPHNNTATCNWISAFFISIDWCTEKLLHPQKEHSSKKEKQDRRFL